MRWFMLAAVLLAGCAVSESGEVLVARCPDCSTVYEGFARCAFFDADEPWARPGMLVDDENFLGVGTPIRQDGYMHEKFCFNATHAVAGSANPTVNGLTRNRNFVARFQSVVMAENFASEYEYLQGEGSGRHTRSWTLNDRPITHLFCPRDGCEEEVLAVLDDAEEEIVFLAFSFTADPIGALLVEKHRLGVSVRGMMEPRNRNGLGSEYDRLVSAGIPVGLPDVPGVMHHKAFVVDRRLAVFGSYNPTASADERNAETIVITEEPVVVQALLAEYSALLEK